MEFTYRPSVMAICATAGRHTCLERSVRFFLDQNYKGKHTLLIFNNAKHPLVLNLPVLSSNKKVVLINSCERNYENLGQIYNDTIPYIDSEIVCFWDDDDIFLPNHISEGVKGYINATLRSDKPYKAYKPEKSYYRSASGIELVGNTLEPSIFIGAEVIKAIGFKETTSDQHLKWVNYLEITKSLRIDPEGEPTLIYNWGDTDIPTWKTSGDPANPNNFRNYRAFSQDHGDGIVTPVPSKEVLKYYNQIVKP